MKQRKPKKYSVIIVPEKDSHIRRLEFSRNLLITLCSGLGVICIAIAACLFTMVHYYQSYQATEGVRIRAAQFEHQRAKLVAEVGSLRDALLRTQRFAAKLTSLADDEPGRKSSTGPLEERFKSLKDVLAGSDELKKGLWRAPVEEDSTGEILSQIDLMKDSTAELESFFHETFARQQDQMFFWASIPSLWPSRGFLTSRFGVSRGSRRHEGIDIAGPVGTPVVAPGDGIVTFTGYKGGYGNTLMIDHGFGIVTVHAHCSRIFVQEGDRIKRGAVIAAVGNTGFSTGPHLHYEVHIDGVPVNPLRYLAKG